MEDFANSIDKIALDCLSTKLPVLSDACATEIETVETLHKQYEEDKMKGWYITAAKDVAQLTQHMIMMMTNCLRNSMLSLSCQNTHQVAKKELDLMASENLLEFDWIKAHKLFIAVKGACMD